MNYVYGPELFPTEARSRGFAFVTLMGGIGFMCSPVITYNLVGSLSLQYFTPGTTYVQIYEYEHWRELVFVSIKKQNNKKCPSLDK